MIWTCSVVGSRPAHSQAPHPEHHKFHLQEHMKYHSTYSKWCQPGFPDCGKSHSCCDGRSVGGDEEGNPQIMGHCYPTEYRIQPHETGDWIAKLAPEDVEKFGQSWINVPNTRIIKEKNPDETGQTGHICTNIYTKQILCSRPPNGAI